MTRTTIFRNKNMNILLGKVVRSSLDENVHYVQIYIMLDYWWIHPASGELQGMYPTPIHLPCIGRVIKSKLYPDFVFLVYDMSVSIYLRWYYIVDDSFYRLMFLSDNIILH
jgi:hypothetical protein